VTTQVDYEEMLGRLLSRIGEDHNIDFKRFSLTKFNQHGYHSGHWTYSIDSFFQVTLWRWFNSTQYIREEVSSPTPVVTPEEETKFEAALKKTVGKLLQQNSPGEE
jgi:hypothetical protein